MRYLIVVTMLLIACLAALLLANSGNIPKPLEATKDPTASTAQQVGAESIPTPDLCHCPPIVPNAVLNIDPAKTQRWTEFAQGLASPTIITKALDFPLYPSATKITKTDSWLQNQPHVIEYDTSDDAQNVIAFYRSVLARYGWRSTVVDAWDHEARLEFEWSSTEKSGGYILWLPIRFDVSDNSDVTQSAGPTHVWLAAERWPLVSTLPLYPGARGIDVNDAPLDGGYVERDTQYEVVASYDEIQRYYESTLAPFGWGFGATPGEKSASAGKLSERDGLTFMYESGSPEQHRYSWLSITAIKGPNGESVVRTKTRGGDLPRSP